ncbi:MAG: hypothetical protein NT144_13035, partial [Bacteroidia bacterium]|nr:hypothetical protein [Bacteroidia bacterium]
SWYHVHINSKSTIMQIAFLIYTVSKQIRHNVNIGWKSNTIYHFSVLYMVYCFAHVVFSLCKNQITTFGGNLRGVPHLLKN